MKNLGIFTTVVILLLFLQTCNKAKLPEVTTTDVSEIAFTSAASGGNVTNNGGDDIISRGVCWSTEQNPTISSDTTINGAGNGPFKSKMAGLTANTTYFVRAYASNSKGVGYGNAISFKTSTTPCDSPAPTTKAATNLGPATATLNASVNAFGSSTDVTFEYGLTTAYGLSITATQSPLTGNTVTDVSAGITGLTQSSVYHFRVIAVSCGGTITGSDLTFQTTCTTSAPGIGTITQPTCMVATGSVVLNGLPATGTWTITRSPGGTITTGTGTTTTISGMAAGTYTFVLADPSGCVSPASGNVVINSQSSSPTAPVVGTITQPTCSLATGSVVLTGLPSSESWTITRTPGGTATTGTGSSMTISNLAQGTYNFTVTNAAGCVSVASGNIVIIAQPATPIPPVVGTITQPICPINTGSVALSGLPSTGTWILTRNPGGTTSGTGTTTNVALLPSGATYTFTVTNASGCTSAPSLNVLINALVLPSATTSPVTNVTPTSVTFTGSANGNGSPSVVTFEYGTTTSYGNEIPADQSPITTGNTLVSRDVTNLSMHTHYHYRVKIVSCAGAVYGLDQEFSTPFPFTTDGLVAYYPFNGNANDESGNGHNGIFLDGAKLAADKNGVANKACSVNSGFVQIADNTALNLSSYTLSIWFKAEGVMSAFNCLIGKNYTIAYGIGFDSGGSTDCPAPLASRPMRVYASNRSNAFNNSFITCGDNTWYHVVVTYNNANGAVNLYINGNLWENGTLPAGTIGNSSDPLAIGKDGHYGDKFTGIVDEVSIFNRVLTDYEVSQLFSYY